MNNNESFGHAFWDYQKTDRYKEGSDPTTLNAAPSQRQFLENRLYWAFSAGWNAAIELREADAENLTPNVSKCGPEGGDENRVQGQGSGPSSKNRDHAIDEGSPELQKIQELTAEVDALRLAIKEADKLVEIARRETPCQYHPNRPKARSNAQRFNNRRTG